MIDSADKAASRIRDALVVLEKGAAFKRANAGDVARTSDQAEENIARRRHAADAKAASAKTAMSTVEQCIALCDEALATEPEPIRIIHHFSCTGGTLFAKCISALPNVLLLNEAAPPGTLPFNGDNPAFTSTDMVALLRQGDGNIPQYLIERLFIANLQVIQEEMTKTGRSLVLREHGHSYFLTGESLPVRPTMRDMIADHFSARSIVVVRNPIDSYLSMQNHSWYEHFSPLTFDEYCRRYLIFLEKHQGIDIIRYEDFVADPPVVMRRICNILDLDYSDLFMQAIETFSSSGSDKRGDDVIEAMQGREVEMTGSYHALASFLGYDGAKCDAVMECSGNRYERGGAEKKQDVQLAKEEAEHVVKRHPHVEQGVAGFATNLKEEAKVEADGCIKAGNLNSYGHNRTLTSAHNKSLRKFAEDSLGLGELKPAYIDYLALKAIHIERTCVGRLATTVQDAVARQLVSESIVGDQICILEIGALYGVGLAILYNHAITRYESVQVVCLDPFDGYYGEALDAVLNLSVDERTFHRNMQLANVPKQDYRVIKHYSTDASALAAARNLPINLLIIDGNHSYEGIKHDFDNYFPLLQPGGYVIFDDYNAKEWPGVQQFVDQDLPAIQEFECLGAISRTVVGRKREVIDK